FRLTILALTERPNRFRTRFRAFSWVRNLEIWQLRHFRRTSLPYSYLRRRGKMSTPLPGLRRATGYQPAARAAHARCGNTRLYELLAAREVEGDVDGRSREITAYSTRRDLARPARNLCG